MNCTLETLSSVSEQAMANKKNVEEGKNTFARLKECNSLFHGHGKALASSSLADSSSRAFKDCHLKTIFKKKWSKTVYIMKKQTLDIIDVLFLWTY